MDALKKNLEKRKTATGGFGIFAKAAFTKDTTIIEFKGLILSEKPKDGQYLQIGSATYLGPSGDFDDYFRHSCNPNAYVSILGNRAFLKAAHLIPAGTEITFDYALTSTETPKDWSMDCSCKAFACRKVISGFASLDDKTKAHYLGLGMVPEYLTKDKK